ncbi:NAD(P)/FAD-dependent oxidoreductase [Oceanicella sp. SM1341]|uniref:flavin-containing monooxygenase n=1 Tax=Oceanicella sp. SM1341 TaxID=1548889 RepID=UPI000E4F59B6|nr:NAD(P)-binding domain-containing protein [Oceanicella sp. SM1341]
MKVCVVGAGPSGLTTVKQLLDEGHDVRCYDRNEDLGGIWLRRGEDGGQMKVFDSLRLTISMKLMAYSDFPHPGRREFFTHAEYRDYLARYARRFGLGAHIRYRTEVTDARREAGRWIVTLCEDGAERRESFDAIAVCAGPFRSPNRGIAELEGFAGEVVHSSEYRNAERFRGRRVLIVGLAESGADIVREIGEVAEGCTLSIRSYTYLLPRIVSGDITTDQTTLRAHHHEMYRRGTRQPFVLPSFWGRSAAARRVFLACTALYGLAAAAAGLPGRLRRRPARPAQPGALNPLGEAADPPKIDIATPDTPEHREMIRTWNRRSHPEGDWAQRGIFCKNVSFIPALVSGRVALNDSGLAAAEGRRVRFRDGSSDEFDTVVLCTGFTPGACALGALDVEGGNVRNLFRHCIHPDHEGTAAFIGFVRPFSGGIPICAEMQARYFAGLCSGRLHLPADLGAVIAREKAWEEHWTALSPRHNEAIPSQVLYLDALAQEIGCLPSAWWLVLRPRLLVRLWFGAFDPACYRLRGPHALGRSARDAIFAEPPAGRAGPALQYSLLQFLPSRMHPRDMA